jgi:hypothetical protein
MTILRTDSRTGSPEEVKARRGTRVPVFTGNPETAIEIIHGLGRVPQDVWITDRNRDCGFYTVSKDAYKHVAVFTEAGVTLYMRYE